MKTAEVSKRYEIAQELDRARQHVLTQQAALAAFKKNCTASPGVVRLAENQLLAAEAWVRDVEYRATEGKKP